MKNNEKLPCYQCLCLPICKQRKYFSDIWRSCSLIRNLIEPHKTYSSYYIVREMIIGELELIPDKPYNFEDWEDDKIK